MVCWKWTVIATCSSTTKPKMDTQQINTILKSDPVTKSQFLGTFPSDMLPKPYKLPFCFVANTQPASMEGEHWIAIHCNANGHGEYMDSYGRVPRKEFKVFLEKYCKSHNFNHRRIQGVLASTCGHYACYYCLMWSRGDRLLDITGRFSREKKVENDRLITRFINKAFDCSFPTYDHDFIVKQIASALKTEDG